MKSQIEGAGKQTSTPWGASFVVRGQPDTENRPSFATKATQKPDIAVDLSLVATKPATKQGASNAPTGSSRGG